MKTNITHKILVLISKEANKRGFKTTLTCDHGEWLLYMSKKDGVRTRRKYYHTRIDRNTKIGDIEEWMES